MKKELKQLDLIISGKLKKGPIKKKIKKKIEKTSASIRGMRPFLKEIDSLLGKLPKKEVDKFAKSKEFLLYKKMMEKYKVK